jgi:hypothetical protein
MANFDEKRDVLDSEANTDESSRPNSHVEESFTMPDKAIDLEKGSHTQGPSLSEIKQPPGLYDRNSN